MRRIAALGAVLAAAAALAAGPALGGNDGPYEVRGYFDNAAFLVSGELVRIAGADVGIVSDVEVSREGEVVGSDGAVPGKAAITMRIDDEAFQDFREDASCLIRPQSLLGEKYVECEPTQPRAPGSPPPPPLEEIPEGQPGEGELFLPLENNGKAVDLDLVNNIMREPYADRFRLILNDLGAGLAARGDDLAEIVERGNPALRETNRVLKILARQSKGLAQLARDGDAVLEPLARERRSVRGFIAQANEAAAAAAERRTELAAGLVRLPPALRELTPTMRELRRFAENAEPVAATLRDAAPALNGATEKLGPFLTEANPTLINLADELEEAAPDLVSSDPVIKQLRDLSEEASGGAASLDELLASLRQSGGYDRVGDFIYNASGAVNAFDSYGHFLRATLLVTNCVDYEIQPTSGCIANWGVELSGSATPSLDGLGRLFDLDRRNRGGTRADDPAPTPVPSDEDAEALPPAPAEEPAPVEPPAEPPAVPDPGVAPGGEGEAGTPPQVGEGGEQVDAQRGRKARMRDARMLLEFLMGDPQ